MKPLALFLLICSLSKSVMGQICTYNQLPSNLKNGLVAYYPFCGNTNDASGNGNNGTANNITFGADRFGNPNSSGVFTKANSSYFFYPAAQQFQPTSFTLSTWFNTNIIQSGGLGSEKDQFIAGYSPNSWASGPSYCHSLGVTSNSILVSLMWTRSTSWEDILTTSGTIKPNEWYNAITTYDITTGKHRFYINGVLYGERTSKIEYFNQSGFYIGASRQNLAGSINTFFDGKIDDVVFWNRALSPCEISQLFNSTNNTFPPLQSPTINSLPDTTSLCGTTKTLDAGAGFSSYLWNTGQTTQSITPNRSGKYTVTVSDASGCTATDSTYLSLVNAKIVQRDTSICIGSTIKLNIDSTLNTGSNKTVRWSNGSSFNSITISPLTSNKYYVTVSDGISTCMDSVMITVVDTTGFNTLLDTTRVCGTTVTLSTITGFINYSWNTGATTQSISPTNSGFYKITATKGGCSISDSTYLSIVQAKILQRDTTICLGSSINLSIDSTTTGATACNSSQFPTTLQNGLVGYYPFCGNATDASGKGNNGIVYGATLDTDRFNNINSAYNFNGSGQYIDIGTLGMPNTPGDLSYSAWIKINKLEVGSGPFSTSSRQFIVISKRHFDNGPSYLTFTVHPDSAIVFMIDGYLIGQGTRAGNVVDGTWKMVTGIKKGNQLKVFIDGRPMDSVQINNTNLSSSNNFHIGHHGAWGHFSNGKIDDVAVWNRALTDNEVSQLYRGQNVTWSTGATSNTITVRPTQTTKYYVTVSNGTSSCVDSITVTVSDLGSFNPLQDTVRICGDSTILDAGPGFAQYKWSNGATTQKISVKSSEKYTVAVTNASGCTTSDSSLVSIVKAKIIQRDTTICKGASITLSIDSTMSGFTACNSTQLPGNLQNGLVAYYPFCGNAIDVSGNGNSAVTSNVVSATDRFGNLNASFQFDGVNSSIISDKAFFDASTNYTISLWAQSLSTNHGVLFNTIPHTILGIALNAWWAGPGKIGFLFGTGQSYGWINGSYYFDGPIDLNAGWFNLVIQKNGLEWKFYFNSVLIKTYLATQQPSNTLSKIVLGHCDPAICNETFNGKIDDVGIWNRILSDSELKQLYHNQNIKWSNGATTNSISVTPTQTTKYYVTVSDGITSCKDSVMVTVSDIGSFNPLQDTVRVCGDSTTLDAGPEFSQYRWSNGATTQKIVIKNSGNYSVAVTNAAGCSASDSSLVSIVKAKIIQRDTTICKTNSITLSIDSLIYKSASSITGFYGPYMIKNSAYYFSKSSTSWANARVLSNNLGGHLAVFEDIEENREVAKISNSFLNFKTASASWFGITDEVKEGVWIDVKGNTTKYTWWSNSNPSNDNGREHYGMFYTVPEGGDGLGTWNDLPDGLGSLPFVVEIENAYQITWSNGENTNAITVSPNQTTKYYVTVSDGITSCQDSITVTVASIDTSVNVLDNPAICSNGGTVRMQAKVGATAYQWKRNGIPISGANSALYTATASGDYHVVLTGNSGCQDSSRTITVKINPVPVPDFSINTANQCLSVNRFSFTNTSTIAAGTMSYNWVLGNGLSSSEISLVYTYPSAGTYTIKLVATSNNNCIDSVTKSITIYAKADTSLTLLDASTSCAKIGTRMKLNSNAAYQWLKDGNMIIGATDIQYTATETGIYRAVVTNSNGCSDTTRQVAITINPLPASNFTISNPSQCLNENNFIFTNTSTISSGTMLYAWDFGDGSSSTSRSPSKKYNRSGTYTIKLVSTSNNLCVDSISKQITVLADADSSISVLDPAEVCSTGGSVRIQAGNAASYTWIKDGIVLNGSTSSLLTATQSGNYQAIVRSSEGCADTSRIVSIVLNPQPVANFTINSIAQCLTENGFNFTNTSTISSGTMSYSWTLGDGTKATTTDASRTYISAGTYNIKLVATSNKLCKDSITKSITVYPQPQIPVITGPDEFCKGSTINLQTSGSPVLNWYKNDVLLAGETLNTLRVTQGGDYKVISTNNNGCKSSSIVKTVIENLLPVGSFDTPTTLNICDGSSLTLSASGASTYQWFYNTNPILGATNATYNAKAAGTYSVDFISNKGCLAKGITTYTLILLKKPVANFVYDTYCAGIQTNFASKSIVAQSGLVRYFWQFGDGKVSSNGQNAFNTYATAGNYRAKLVVTPVECPQLADSTEILIPVQTPPAGFKYPPVNAIINRAQQLSARNIGITYQWTPASYLSSSTSRTPTITTSKEQLYLIYITNQAGCNIVDTQLVRVFPDRNIYVPEGFTPDNDGHNDRLYPILVGIDEMRVFKIFNRWGTLVFDNKNATVNTGWNGTYLGRTQPMDTYAWIAEGIDVDGKLVTRTGNTILIR